MKSMTGYGKGTASQDGLTVTIEIKAVNHRFLDLLFKLPRGLAVAEDYIRKIIQSSISRGHLDIFCNYEDNRALQTGLQIDTNLVNQYKYVAEELAKFGFKNDLSVSNLIKIPDILQTNTSSNGDSDELMLKLIVKATEIAVKNLSDMRAKEGEILVVDIKSRLSAISNFVVNIAERAPLVANDYKIRLTQRIQEALNATEIDQNKLISEVAFFIDRSNIDEEITRLNGHISHYLDILQATEASGKKLDFLTQECNREVNTIGSKSNDIIITQNVLLLKNEVEKIREQVQNLE